MAGYRSRRGSPWPVHSAAVRQTMLHSRTHPHLVAQATSGVRVACVWSRQSHTDKYRTQKYLPQAPALSVPVQAVLTLPPPEESSTKLHLQESPETFAPKQHPRQRQLCKAQHPVAAALCLGRPDRSPRAWCSRLMVRAVSHTRCDGQREELPVTHFMASQASRTA